MQYEKSNCKSFADLEFFMIKLSVIAWKIFSGSWFIATLQINQV